MVFKVYLLYDSGGWDCINLSFKHLSLFSFPPSPSLSSSSSSFLLTHCVCYCPLGRCRFSDLQIEDMQGALPKSSSLMRLCWHAMEYSSGLESISLMHIIISKYFYRFTGWECGEGWEFIFWLILKFGLNVDVKLWSLLRLMENVPLWAEGQKMVCVKVSFLPTSKLAGSFCLMK